MSGEARPAKSVYEATTLAAAATTDTTAGATGDAVRLPVAPAYAFILDVTAAATDAGDTLDVQVQTLIDGTNWIPVVHFTQCIGTGGAKRYVAKICPRSTAQAEFESSATLTAGNVRHLAGDAWRVQYVQVNTSTNNDAFTWSVVGIPQ